MLCQYKASHMETSAARSCMVLQCTSIMGCAPQCICVSYGHACHHMMSDERRSVVVDIM